jgi:hypothetical protein
LEQDQVIHIQVLDRTEQMEHLLQSQELVDSQRSLATEVVVVQVITMEVLKLLLVVLVEEVD